MPDFLVIGAPKAGTTALHAVLSEHPGLYLSAIKEPKFFLTDGPPPTKGGPGDTLTYREHVWRRADYKALFAPAPPGTLRGESTPLYLYDRAAMRRIRDTLPAARLIVIVRDPVERAHSNWTHLWSAGLEPIADFVRACGEEERRIAAGWASFWHYIGLGRYGEQLAYLFTLFPREQVLVLRYRRLVDEPAQTLDRICAFLGVETGLLTEIPRQNVTSHPESTLAHRAVSVAQRAASVISTRQCLVPNVAQLRYSRHRPSGVRTRAGRSSDSVASSCLPMLSNVSNLSPSADRATATAYPRPGLCPNPAGRRNR